MERFTKSTLNNWFENLQREDDPTSNETQEDNDYSELAGDMNFTINPSKQVEESWIDLEDKHKQSQSRYISHSGEEMKNGKDGKELNDTATQSAERSRVKDNIPTPIEEQEEEGEEGDQPHHFDQLGTSLTTILGRSRPYKRSYMTPSRSTSPFTSMHFNSSQIPRISFLNVESSSSSQSVSSSDINEVGMTSSNSKKLTKRYEDKEDQPKDQINFINLALIIFANAMGFFLLGFLCGVRFKRSQSVQSAVAVEDSAGCDLINSKNGWNINDSLSPLSKTLRMLFRLFLKAGLNFLNLSVENEFKFKASVFFE
ncbi:hypothetical protein WICPIJ_003019 [Wickerhamomyces pijperi]|uniref:Uncharacterized protein n=1 Tax=Wickerhamomyces pijperi TaxID=599730 RepID=A0A9P8QAR7_WICPI|nr:hypothetical protein WICPIJ_003019 [Wickerhamomyces pijperi]